MGRVIIGIPTLGRAPILLQTIHSFTRQQRLPDLVVISCTGDADVAGLKDANLPFAIKVVSGPKGATLQRNRILATLKPGDIALLLDDDFLMAADYLTRLERIFDAAPDVAMATGTVLADGILGPGYSHDQGRAIIQAHRDGTPGEGLVDVANGYGCNFAFRADPVIEHGIRFDERLPLYSWLEDVDFSTQISPHGRIVRAEALRGVHLGTKSGRTPGLLFGYSQIANPIYLMRKGTMPAGRAVAQMLRNIAANIVRSVVPQPWADHRGRLRGNLLAIGDVLRGRASPERILSLKS